MLSAQVADEAGDGEQRSIKMIIDAIKSHYYHYYCAMNGCGAESEADAVAELVSKNLCSRPAELMGSWRSNQQYIRGGGWAERDGDGDDS